MNTSISTRLLLILTSLVLVGLGIGACGREGQPLPDLKDRDVQVTFLHTSDIHSRLLSYKLTPGRTDINFGLDPDKNPFGGVARIMSVVRRERAKADRIVHLDSGDLFQGAPIFNVFQGEPELRSLAMMQLDVYVLGNHDFDNGGVLLSRQIASFSHIPMLSANYIYLNDARRPTSTMLRDLTQPYTILNAKGFRIGVIGLANTSTLTSLAEGGNSLGITAREPNQVLQQYVNAISKQVDFVVALTHIGLTEDEHLITGYYREEADKDGKTKRTWVEGVKGLDVVVGGHHHVVLNPPKVLIDPDGREVLLVHSGAFSKYVGRLDMVVRNGELRSYRFQPIPITSEVKEDPDMVRMLEPYVLQLNKELDTTRIFAYAPQLVARFGRGTGDSALGNLVAQAMAIRQRVEADFALTNSLGIRTDLQAGPVSLEQFYEIFPFENTIATIFLSGREVREMLDFVTDRSSGRGCQSQAQVSGINFIMNCGTNKAEGICIGSTPNPTCASNGNKLPCFDTLATTGPRACKFGSPINDFTSYKVAANDYIANGGSGFKVLQRNTTQFDTGISLRDALIEYIEGQPSCRKVNENRKKKDLKPFDIPEKYLDLPCIVSDEDGRIRRKLQ